MEKEMAELREAAMRLHCALAYAPVDGVKLSAGLVQLNAALGMALQAVDAASRREVQA
jgi:hypothetical protein